MKQTLLAGIAVTKRVLIDEGRCISFMGKENMVYATPQMVSDVEYACRDFLLAHLDPGEEVGRGSHVRFVVDTAKSRERIAAKRARMA
jgi:predicted thioesterase